MIQIIIDTNNAAFEDNFHYEVGRILDKAGKLIYKVEEGGFEVLKLKDTNGNTVATVEMDEK
jgi:hypothetical protein